MKLLTTHRQTLFLVLLSGVAILFGVVMMFVLSSQTFGENYSVQLQQNPTIAQFVNNQQTFTVKRILVELEGSCETLEIKVNGEAKQIECDDTYIENRKILSNERIQKLFGGLDRDSFAALGGKYYAPNLEKDIVITIETNYGSKTIIISSDDDSAPGLTEELEDIVEEIEEVEEEVNQPDPTPVPTPSPTPSLPPGATPTPYPSGVPTPTPSPTPTPDPQATAVPFSCDMLDDLDVTVSNIRCLEDDFLGN